MRRVIFNLEYNYNYHVHHISISDNITGSCNFVEIYVFVDDSTSTLLSGLKNFVNDTVTTLGFVSGVC